MQNIKEIKKRVERNKYNATKTKLAKDLGMSVQHLCNILAGRRKAKPEVMSQIKKHYNSSFSNN